MYIIPIFLSKQSSGQIDFPAPKKFLISSTVMVEIVTSDGMALAATSDTVPCPLLFDEPKEAALVVCVCPI